MPGPRFVVVIHPEEPDADAIFNALSVQGAVAINIQSYAEWLAHEIVTSYDLLYIRKAGQWEYARSLTEKLAIREQLLKTFIRS